MSYTTAAFDIDGETYIACAWFNYAVKDKPWGGYLMKDGVYIKSLGIFDKVPDVWHAAKKELGIKEDQSTESESLDSTDGPLGLLEESEPERS